MSSVRDKRVGPLQLPWGLRWWEVAPEAVLGIGLGLFTVTEPSAAASAFSSPTALALMAAAAAVWGAGRLVLLRFTDQPFVRLAVFGAAAVAVLAVVVLPAYRDTTVVETLPRVAAPATAVTTAAPVTTTPGTASPSTAAAGGTAPASAAAAATTTAPTAAAAPTTTSVPVAEAAEPVRVRSGALNGIDHRATGSVVVYRHADGSLLVGLEDIDIQPGPDYDVYVVAGAGREDVGGGVRLDDLRGNKGTQYYEVPAGTALLEGQWTVLVWCQTFDVPVAGATPA